MKQSFFCIKCWKRKGVDFFNKHNVDKYFIPVHLSNKKAEKLNRLI